MTKINPTQQNNTVGTYTNTGAGGGTGYYINLGGVKICWGFTGAFTSTSNTTYAISLPSGFFSAIQSAKVDVWGSSAVISEVGQSYSTSQLVRFFSTAASNNVMAWIVIGN